MEKDLEEKLRRIFGINRVMFSAQGMMPEQDALFVEISSVRNSMKESRHHARVTGRLAVHAQSGKIPFGYFAKRIEEADASDTINFFFYEFEENAIRFQNIVTRSLSFVFFYNEQYNPETGIINQINLEQVTE